MFWIHSQDPQQRKCLLHHLQLQATPLGVYSSAYCNTPQAQYWYGLHHPRLLPIISSELAHCWVPSETQTHRFFHSTAPTPHEPRTVCFLALSIPHRTTFFWGRCSCIAPQISGDIDGQNTLGRKSKSGNEHISIKISANRKNPKQKNMNLSTHRSIYGLHAFSHRRLHTQIRPTRNKQE